MCVLEGGSDMFVALLSPPRTKTDSRPAPSVSVRIIIYIIKYYIWSCHDKIRLTHTISFEKMKERIVAWRALHIFFLQKFLLAQTTSIFLFLLVV